MKNFIKKCYIRMHLVAFIVIFLFCGCSTTNHDSLYRKFPAFYSYIIGDIKTGFIYEECNSEVYASPASCQKVITALVALKQLGPNYRYITKLFINKKQRGIGNIVISFSGDPTFSTQDLMQLLSPMKNMKIKGDIILDSSCFKTSPHSENIMVCDIGTKYAQPVCAMNIDKNLVNVKITPSNAGANIENDAGYKVDSSIKTSVDKSSIDLRCENNKIKATGIIDVKQSLLELQISPIEIDRYALHKVTEVLKSLNITGNIKIIYKHEMLPKDLIFINSVESAPLREIIKPALKKSDNFVFDAIYLKLIHSMNPEKIKTWRDGDEIMKNLLDKHFDIKLDNCLIVDGSGLSHYNRIQPKQLFDILRKGARVQGFSEALASPGERESTLKYRSKIPNNILAKTGSFSGTRCLCGYSQNEHKEKMKAFVIISNSFAQKNTGIEDVIDEFVKERFSK